ncbi:MAG: alpha-glucuronidase family glycosyl hydrolase [Bryobacteraceae bacterium]
MASAYGESGYNSWLRYERLEKPPALPAVVTILTDTPVLRSAQGELIRGLRGMTDRTLRASNGSVNEPAIVLDTRATNLKPDGYQLRTERGNIVISASSDRGVLYGAFALLEKIALGERITNLNERHEPGVAIRWVNHWDNLDGTIERGYGGRSIFWDNVKSRTDLTQVTDYARMLASLGINGASINNVNVNPRILATDFLPEIVRIADAMRPWGVHVALSVDFGSPQKIGGLDTFDPLDPRVIAWWKAKTDEVYKAVPDLAGFIIKADSEGRVGPSAYGRTHADATNVVARALKPHGGLIFYRGFVYDNKMDWRNLKNDRARAADDNFRKLDGTFEDNAIVQVKNGPIDFQVREPASPLFGTLEKTKQAIELQITQEYFGQAKHTVFLVPMWKDVLDFDLRIRDGATPVKSVVNAVVAVSNVGLDENWLGNHLSQANLYGFGKLAWDANLTSKKIVEDWAKLTFGNDPKVLDVVTRIQLDSWRTFENYTGPLGLQTLTDITGNHYGVAVEASEGNGWGQWHRADEKGVGMDRSVATGTGFSGQYRPAVARVYESLEQTPDELITWFHHVPYTYKLHSGKTVIQHLYDSHYEGAAAVEGYAREWRSLASHMDERRYTEIQAQLDYQAGQATVWRDAVNNWFAKASSIPDAKGRVGNHPGRTEAEALRLDGYTPMVPIRWESASGGTAVECKQARCEASLRHNGPAGWFKIRVQYFDQNNGQAGYRVRIGDQLVDEWRATFIVPTARIDSSSSSRRTIQAVALRPGDVIRIEGLTDAGELAGLDYIEILPAD